MADRSNIVNVELKKDELDDFFGLRLVSLTIYPETIHALRKVLKPGTFQFANEHIADSWAGKVMEVRLYGKNIISAIGVIIEFLCKCS